MKKFISKILALSLSLGLCGCGGTQTASTEAKPTETIPKPFDYYAYEVRITKFPMGTAELLQQEQTKMLDAIFAESGLTETEKTPGYLTEEFRPVTNGVTYTPISTEAVAVENGFYAFQLFDGTAVKNMLAISKEVAEQVLAKESTMLLFDAQNVIAGIA